MEEVLTLASTILIAIGAFVSLILLLRISGKRVLSKWNSFDFVVTVALGSAFATTIVSKQTSLLQGIAAFLALITMQFILTKLSVHFTAFESLIKSRPRALVLYGNYLDKAMRKERVTKREIRATIRSRGFTGIEKVDLVILETDGSFTVIDKLDKDQISALEDVEGIT